MCDNSDSKAQYRCIPRKQQQQLKLCFKDENLWWGLNKLCHGDYLFIF